MSRYPLFFAKKNIQGEVINIEIKTWAKGIVNKYDSSEICGIQGKIKQFIYNFLKGNNINLYIIDLNLKDNLIGAESPTFLKLSLMFNPEGHFNDEKTAKLYEGFSNFLKAFNTISFSPNKCELN